MPRGVYHRKQITTTTGEVMPGVDITAIAKSAQSVLPDFKSQAWWEKLNQEEKTRGEDIAMRLTKARLVVGFGDLATGAVLTEARELFEPLNTFGKFLKPFHFSVSTAYRFIRKFRNAKANLHENIVRAAMARGIPIAGDNDQKPLGMYTLAAAKLPPPKEPDVDQANTWLDQVEAVRKETAKSSNGGGGSTVAGFDVPATADPQTSAKEVVRLAVNRYNKLPHNKRTRDAWSRQVLGMLAFAFHIDQVAHVTIPEGFIVGRGAPRKAQAAA